MCVFVVASQGNGVGRCGEGVGMGTTLGEEQDGVGCQCYLKSQSKGMCDRVGRKKGDSKQLQGFKIYGLVTSDDRNLT